jgi:formate dehydrogenase major subunit
MAELRRRMRALYAASGGAFPDPILNLNWPYANADDPTPDEIAREVNGSALEDLPDAKDPTKIAVPKGQQLDSFAQLTADGKTASGCWIYCGSCSSKGNMMARRDTTDPEDAGLAPNWAWAWPVNRRILYNRASADVNGKAWGPRKKLIEWNGEKWVGLDVPDYGPTVPPAKSVGPFIMNPEGVARLFTRAMMRDGPFPTHYEPFESPIDNPIAPKIRGNPVARVFKDDLEVFGTASDFPYAATTYRLTEHFHYWTKHNRVNSVLQPELFVEISEQLAAEKGIVLGSWVKVWSNRGYIKAKAVVTKRIKPLVCDGKTVHIVGIPLHWGFTGVARKGFGTNTLTPYVGDANIETPEYKAFLVDIEPTSAPVA